VIEVQRRQSKGHSGPEVPAWNKEDEFAGVWEGIKKE
jgi:hypothetical protein